MLQCRWDFTKQLLHWSFIYPQLKQIVKATGTLFRDPVLSTSDLMQV